MSAMAWVWAREVLASLRRLSSARTAWVALLVPLGANSTLTV